MAGYSFDSSPRRGRSRLTVRRVGIALVLAFLAGGLVVADWTGLFGAKPKPDMEKYDGKEFRVVHVVDGDTLDLDIPDPANPSHSKNTRVRLWGVDTPETVKPNTPVQRFGPQASDFVKKTASDQVVRVELDPRELRDKYGRLVAYIYLPDKRMLNRVLVEEGYGYADPRFPHKYKDEFARLQNAAKNAGRGLWKDITNDDLPYYYKDKLKLSRR